MSQGLIQASGANVDNLNKILISYLFYVFLNLLGYKYFGLSGLGISFLISYIFFLIQVFLIAKFRYEFGFTNSFYKIFVLQLLLAITCLVAVKLLISPYSYIFGFILIALSSFFSYRELDKRLGIKSIFSDIKSRF